MASVVLRPRRTNVPVGNETKYIFLNGTLKTASKQFAQLYVVHVDLGSTREGTNVTPAVFALLPDKKKITYIRRFQAIFQVVLEWAPETVNIDFEAGATEAIRHVFPRTEVQVCIFHFSQSLWRKVQNIGLTSMYKSNQEV